MSEQELLKTETELLDQIAYMQRLIDEGNTSTPMLKTQQKEAWADLMAVRKESWRIQDRSKLPVGHPRRTPQMEDQEMIDMKPLRNRSAVQSKRRRKSHVFDWEVSIG